MTVEFISEELLSLYIGNQKGKPKFQESVLRQYRKVIDLMLSVESITDLRQFKSLNLHTLERDLVGKFAVRVNMKYRIVFSLIEDEIQIEGVLVEDLTDYH
ncbi:type II toxin-antitoxin system RelE/ParE family toxin [Arcicella sp. LKC2W]|uniref:type II toxin-antitoxin system RelE/ParE family toxin n=1 Tax=Arcicella sp. LKC2W TaxID=2984198 RepID=UPI002B1F57E0|nr:type II toxin-antitoxin system RelE/ParE family toxin [Arcicella sp. LKC2W]MEA5459253.1 type II toxin-antitoxin system RelE/ParE family toxin [Arcicella sp. LKC2W]